jgi:hypothetical protein
MIVRVKVTVRPFRYEPRWRGTVKRPVARMSRDELPTATL